MALVLVALLVAGAGSLPIVCGACHSAQASELAASGHAGTGCYSCHAPGVSAIAFKGAEITRMYPRALIGQKPSGAVAETARAACESCHDSMTAAVGTTEGSTGIRIAHASCADEATCDSCHAPVAHGVAVRWKREPVMEDCTACHQDESVSVDCDTCHTEREKADRLEAGPWQITHGPNWKSTHGMGDLKSCSVCHPDDYCVRCHGSVIPHAASFGREHGQAAVEARDKCMECHQQAAYCDSCHGVEMPHPEGFIKTHAEEAETVSNPQCVRCHTVEDCGLCHERHTHPGGANMFPASGSSYPKGTP